MQFEYLVNNCHDKYQYLNRLLNLCCARYSLVNLIRYFDFKYCKITEIQGNKQKILLNHLKRNDI